MPELRGWRAALGIAKRPPRRENTRPLRENADRAPAFVSPPPPPPPPGGARRGGREGCLTLLRFRAERVERALRGAGWLGRDDAISEWKTVTRVSGDAAGDRLLRPTVEGKGGGGEDSRGRGSIPLKAHASAEGSPCGPALGLQYLTEFIRHC